MYFFNKLTHLCTVIETQLYGSKPDVTLKEATEKFVKLVLFKIVVVDLFHRANGKEKRFG